MGLVKPYGFMGSSVAGALVDTGLNFYVDAGLTDSYPGSGTLWTDLESTTNITLDSGITHTSGDDGYLDVDDVTEDGQGSTGVFVLPTTANAEFTVELLVYPTAVTARYGAMFNYWGDNSANTQAYWFGHNNSGGVHVNMRDGGNSLGYQSSTNPFSNNNWYHIVFACELGNDMRVYVNNSLIDTDDLSGIVQLDRTSSVGGGAYLGLWQQTQTTSNNTMLGRMATARHYSGYNFTADDVENNYNYWKDVRGYAL